MDPRCPILPSQSYSSPSAPNPLSLVVAEYAADNNNNNNTVGLASYDPGTAITATTSCLREGPGGSANSRQPLSESTGNVQHPQHQAQHSHSHQHHQQPQYHQQQHHPQIPTHYPAGQYPLPSLQPISRSCTPGLSSTPSLGVPSAVGGVGAGGPLAPPVLGSNAPHHGAATGLGTTGSGGGGAAGSAAVVPSTSSMRLRRYHELLQKRNRNPIYDCPEFAQYRLKQKDKDRQVWPDTLENAFLDALLLILHMGRRKFYMGGKQHGRNMIISEYIWLRWVATLPPGTNPSKVCEVKGKDGRLLNLPDEHPDKYHKMYRKRKQVSSHIQVLKGFFRLNWAYNFLFSKGKEEGSKDKNKQPAPNRWYKENTDQRSFKGDPVLTALERKQLPTVRPNYEYFRQLLAMDTKVQVRPSTCWVYVANPMLQDKPASSSVSDIKSTHHAQHSRHHSKDSLGKPEDGGRRGEGGNGSSNSSNNNNNNSSSSSSSNSMYSTANPNGANTTINTYHARKGLLFREDFPHRYAFNNPAPGEESPWTPREREIRNIRRNFLHEYAWPLKQTESSSVREVLDEWEGEHPELHKMLRGVMEQHDLQNAHALPASKLCDIIHVDVTFDVHRVHCLPEGTTFEWPFKISVAQPGLVDHDWRVRTWLERPVELARSSSAGSKAEVGRGEGLVRTKHEKAMFNEVSHTRGCSGGGGGGGGGDDNPHCDCRNSRPRSGIWLVPVPANTWAESLMLCAQFPRYLVPKKRNGSHRSKKEDEMPESDTVTQMDLMRGTAMFQELWSSAPVSSGAMDHLHPHHLQHQQPPQPQQATWTRRAVILWTFNTIHFFDKDNNLCETPAGTQWRFLSAVDPLSAVHQERMLLQGNSALVHVAADGSSIMDRGIMSPTPSYQLLNHHMTENMNAALWGLPTAGGGAGGGAAHSAPTSLPVSPLESSYGPSPLHVHGTFANGLVTPPASATLPSTLTFEGAPSLLHPQSGGGLGGEHLGYLPVSSVDTTNNSNHNKQHSFVGDGDLYGNPYMTTTTAHGSFYEEGDDNESDTTLPGGEATATVTATTDLTGFNAHQWPGLANGSNSAVGNGGVSLDWDNHALHSLSMVAAEEMAAVGDGSGGLDGDGGDAGRVAAGGYVDEDVVAAAQQHQQHQHHHHHQQHSSYDPFAQLRAEDRERRTATQSPEEVDYARHYLHHATTTTTTHPQHSSTSLRDTMDHATGVRRQQHHQHAGESSQDYRDDHSAAVHHHLSQVTASWGDPLGQLHQHQQHHHQQSHHQHQHSADRLQDYGAAAAAASMGTLLGRKRRREDDDEAGGANRFALGAMGAYGHRDDGRYAAATTPTYYGSSG
ncbi:hypothetical protein BD289DRAFT_482283 [Coniella lustricola]|uniref:TEA domain-containing protein n=1 Tax=Coniella lustricola TaxID=2025994 RepID=A0A2T3A9E0_9PEZI|nr:hypothetical protein BD289DRAFT_482283 [Coniella lustricola]